MTEIIQFYFIMAIVVWFLAEAQSIQKEPPRSLRLRVKRTFVYFIITFII